MEIDCEKLGKVLTKRIKCPSVTCLFLPKSKTIKLIVLLAYDQPRKSDTFFYKQRVTCEKNDVCATVTIDADFDRQIHNNNNNMQAIKVKRVVVAVAEAT